MLSEPFFAVTLMTKRVAAAGELCPDTPCPILPSSPFTVIFAPEDAAVGTISIEVAFSIRLSGKAGRGLAGRLGAVRRVLPVYIDAEIRVVPQQVALLALLVYGQIGQVCNLIFVAVAVAVGQIILQVDIDADPVDVLQAVADYNSLGVFEVVR